MSDDDSQAMTVHDALPLIEQNVRQAAQAIQNLLQLSGEGWLDIPPMLYQYMEPLPFLGSQHDEPLQDTPDYYGAPKPIKLYVHGNLMLSAFRNR